MEVTSPILRRVLGLVIGVAGVLVAWFLLESSGLLVAVAVVCIWLGWEAGLATIVVAGIVWTAILSSRAPLAPDDAVRIAVFVGAAGAIWLIVQVFRTVSLSDVLDQDSRLVTDIPGLGWYAYPDGRLRFINPAVLAFLGVTPSELRKLMEKEPNPLERWVHPEDRQLNLANWERALKKGEPLIDESRVLRHDGEYRLLRDTIVPTRDGRGRITGWYGHTTDVTDHRRAEEALRQSERELRLLIDTVPTMIFLMTPQGLPYYFNKRFVDWAGVDPGDTSVARRQLDAQVELLHPDDRADVAAVFERSFSTGEPLQYRGRLRRKDGQFRWLDSRVEPLRDEDGTIIRWYGVNTDIDDEVRSQEALRLADDRLARASRAASLSELAVSIAHELNSPLQAVVSNANAYERWLGADPPNYERASLTAERIIRDANAAADVVGRIRALFRHSGRERSLVNLNALITEVCGLVSDALQASNVRLDLDLDPQLPAITADYVQLEQVVLNLVRNAIEAMQQVSSASRTLRIVSRRYGDEMIEVEVRDQGHGISHPERIFDAFYTTKRDGLGMGLAICRSILEAHGGRISAKPIPQGGSSFGFMLPLRVASPFRRERPLEGDARIGERLADLDHDVDEDVDGAKDH